MFKSKLQVFIFIIGLVALGLGIKTMLQTPTLILTSQFLVLLYTPILLVLSLGLGFGIKKGLNSNWHTLTFSSIIIIVVCGTFFLTQHRSNELIEIPPNYKGQVYLILSNEQHHDFEISEQGIGYITEQSMKDGFMPTVYQDGTEISDQIKGYAYGSGTFNFNEQTGSLDYVKFEIHGGPEAWNAPRVNDLIKSGAIDLARVKLE